MVKTFEREFNSLTPFMWLSQLPTFRKDLLETQEVLRLSRRDINGNCEKRNTVKVQSPKTTSVFVQRIQGIYFVQLLRKDRDG